MARTTAATREHILDVLDEVSEYFDERADADCDGESYHGNEEMQLFAALETIKPLITKLLEES